ncbi:MAG TPA: HAD family hydrolase [Ktedonobacteraceae bacterium]|nr:HAD family hydrolase [Ktedonobacteraceae bacterium]
MTAIIFDLDETLITDDEATAQALARVCLSAQKECGLDSGRLQEAVYQQAQHLWHDSPMYDYCRMLGISASEGLLGRFSGAQPQLQALYRWIPDYQHATWRRALAEQGAGDDALATRLASLFAQERRVCQALFPEVEQTLRDLHQQYQLALLTNGAPDLQREKIAHFNLDQYFDAVVVSGEVGVGKPHPAVFRAVLDQLAVSPQAAFMVGDNLRRDIAGAAQLGMRGIWVNRYKKEIDPAYATYVHTQITDLTGLYQVL